MLNYGNLKGVKYMVEKKINFNYYKAKKNFPISEWEIEQETESALWFKKYFKR